MTDAGAGGQFEIFENIASGTVASLQKIIFNAPAVSKAASEHLHIEIRTRQGALLAENDYQFFIFPSPAPAMEIPLQVHDSLGTLARLNEKLAHAGYLVNGSTEQNTILISSQLDEFTRAHLAAGKKALLLLDSEDGLPSEVPLKVLVRAGCELDGRWFSNFNWVRTDRAPFDQLDFGRILGFESSKVVPHYVIDGLPPDQFPDALAGVTYGWLARNMVLAVPFEFENGKALATTFRFHEYGLDPYATNLLDGFIKTLASDKKAELRVNCESVEIV
jgi:hypothetical protein